MPGQDDPTAPSPAKATAIVVARAEHEGGLRLGVGELFARRYRIGGLRGRGGMGEVYQATDTRLGVEVALKTLPAGDPNDRAHEALRREIVHGRKIAHRNVCRMFDLGEHDGLEFVTMELLDGETLADRLARAGCLGREAALPLLAQIADGVAAMHAVGVVHRDLKPSNVMLVEGRAVVTDFGLARVLGAARTQSGDVHAGTPAYMAPEQLTGDATTERTDVYALGILAYEVLAGRLPFVGDNPAATAMMRLTRDPDPLDDAHADQVLRRAMARAPADRFATPTELIAALAAPPRPRSRRRWWPFAVPIVIAAAALTWWLLRPGEAAPTTPAPLLLVGGPGADNLDAIATIGDDLVIAGKVSADATLAGHELAIGDAGARGGVIARVGADGRLRWVRVLAGNGDVRINNVAVAPDGTIAIGGMTYTAVHLPDLDLPPPAHEADGFVAVLDGATGAFRWSQLLGASDTGAVRAVAFDDAGALYVSGELGGVARFGGDRAVEAPGPPGTRSPFVASYDPTGALRWVTAAHGARNARAFGLAVARDRLYLAGMLDGDTEIGAVHLAATAKGDAFLVRLDARTGAPDLGRVWVGSDGSGIVGVAAAADGRLAIAGDFRGTLALRAGQPMVCDGPYEVDGFLAELDADGEVGWADQLTGPGADRVVAVAIDGTRIDFAGHFADTATLADRTLTSHGGADMLFGTATLDGALGEVTAIGGVGDDRARRVAIAADGTALIAGYLSRRVEHDGAAVDSRGLADGAVVRIAPAK